MEHSLYRLNFTTALHIGKNHGGPSLDDGQMTIHADTLFSALCCEAVKSGRLEQLAAYFAEGVLTISDALPYFKEELYLPKPVLILGDQKREGDSRLKKQLKSLNYIPLSAFNDYLKGLRQPGLDSNQDLENLKQEFGHLSIQTKVALKGQNPPRPYHVAVWHFVADCGLDVLVRPEKNQASGLYVLVRSEQKEALDTFEKLLRNLGLSGIGGKQSAGLGKFRVQQTEVPAPLMELLMDQQAEYQMLLGTALPEDAELETLLGEGWYTIVRRGGFVRSENYAPLQLKKRSVYMLAPGSCLRRRFNGQMLDLADQGAHPVWRCARTLFAGVKLC